MARLWGTRTHENLLRAFSAEAQANQRYDYFARMAEADGRDAAAASFRIVADAENDHALRLLEFLGDIGDPTTDLPIGNTLLNLKASIAGETQDAGVYPQFARMARAEGFPAIASWFETVAEAKELHVTQFRDLLAAVD